MMLNAYSLPPRKARICRFAAAVFLALSGLTTLTAVGVVVYSGMRIACEERGCTLSSDATQLLGEDQRPPVVASPTARAAFDAYAARPVVRAWVIVGAIVNALPFGYLLFSFSRALRRLAGTDGNPLEGAVPWLRRASQAAIVAAIATPLGDSIVKTTLSLGTPAGLHVPIDLYAAGLNLMLAFVVRSTVWALEAGLQAQRDLAEIV